MSFTSEKISETKQCLHCSSDFNITDKDLTFYDKISPIFNGEKYSIPNPNLCPDCRMQRRMSFRNESNLYKSKCSATGKDIISMFSPDKTHTIYEQKFWYSDNWDAMDYGIMYDETKTFFQQFGEMFGEVPLPSMYSYFSENSDYCNCVNYLKDCYLVFASSQDEKCYYSNYINDCTNVSDSFMTFASQECYYCIDCKNCNNCKYSSNLENCSFCFGSSNLYGKSYCFENIQLSKDEYMEKIKSVGYYQLDQSGINKGIMKSFNGKLNENSVGNYINNSKNTYYSFDVNNLEDCKYNAWFYNSNNCYDTYSWGQNASFCYESVAIGHDSSTLVFCGNTHENSSHIFYSMFCSNVKNCFGCIGIRDKQYCIFNKQYTKEEYHRLVPKIINQMKANGEWGEFFPSSISPFGYNETVAQEYFPLEKQEAVNSTFNWLDYETPHPNVDKVVSATKLPENISDIPDDILNWAIECEVTKKPFRIIPQELGFYRKHNLPIPRRHPDQRHLDRMKLRNPRKLFKRDCDKCGVEMDTTYGPERKETVYCEGCYNKEVY